MLVYNDPERGRHSLAVSLSDDEGRTWKWTRHLERDAETADAKQRGEYHYPSIMQAADGTLHVTYSYFRATGVGDARRAAAAAPEVDQARALQRGVDQAGLGLRRRFI